MFTGPSLAFCVFHSVLPNDNQHTKALKLSDPRNRDHATTQCAASPPLDFAVFDQNSRTPFHHSGVRRLLNLKADTRQKRGVLVRSVQPHQSYA
jgi:hypothetical protein